MTDTTRCAPLRAGGAARDALDKTASRTRMAIARRSARTLGPIRRDGLWRVADGWITSGMVDLSAHWPVVVEVDLETSGFDPVHDRIIEIGLSTANADGTTTGWSTLVDPRRRVRREALELTGIDPDELSTAPGIAEALDELARRVPAGAVLSAYGAGFDRAHLQNASRRTGVALPTDKWGCVLDLARKTLVDDLSPPNFKLTTVCEWMGIPLDHAHRGFHDAKAAASVRRALLAIPTRDTR